MVESSYQFYPSKTVKLLAVAVGSLSILIGYVMTAGNPYLVVALAAGIGLVAACFRWPSLFIALYFSYALLGSVLPAAQLTLAGMNVYPSDFLIMLALIVIALVAWQRRLEWPRSRLVLPLVLFLVLVGFETGAGFLRGYALRSILRDVANALGYIMVMVGFNLVRDKRTLGRWAMVLFVAGSLTAAYAIAMRVLGIETVRGFEGSDTANTIYGQVSRSYGLPGAASFYLFAFFIGAALLAERASLWASSGWTVLGVGTVLCFVQILLLYGRSLFLGVLAGVTLMALTWPASRRVKMAVVGIVAALAVFVVAPQLNVPYTAPMADRYLSIVSRTAGGAAAYDTIRDRQNELRVVWTVSGFWEKIVGFGLGARHLAVYADREEVYHNAIAETIFRMGVLGVAIFVWFMAQMVRETAETVHWKGDPSLQAFHLALMASFMATVVWGLGTAGMPFAANATVCAALGMALRARELLRPDLGL